MFCFFLPETPSLLCLQLPFLLKSSKNGCDFFLQHVVVELESSANVRFLHARAEAKSLSAIAALGGAGAGGAADEAHYLWPKFAAGMTYNSSFVDSMFGQAFYRPSRFVCPVLCCVFVSRASCARFVPI